jgi:pyruvyltransferase
MKLPYKLSKDIILEDGAIPLTWWNLTPNFGDLLSPYLINKLTSKPVKLVHLNAGYKRNIIKKLFQKNKFSYFAIGSIISRVTNKSVVWGSGAFGTEDRRSISQKATYLAVRGPLTRNLLRIYGVKNIPEIYGDPALLMPMVFDPEVKKTHKLGIILRWSESDWNKVEFDPDIKKIYLGTDDIEGTLKDIISCEKILSSSLHGIILADAYGIPSAWLKSDTPKGFEFKFYDYFISVNKLQKPQTFNFLNKKVTLDEINKQITFDDRLICFDSKALLSSCPFIDKDSVGELLKT